MQRLGRILGNKTLLEVMPQEHDAPLIVGHRKRSWKDNPMRRVIIESPYNATTTEGVKANIEFVRACCLDATRRGEVPFASHLFFTQFLNDQDPAEHKLGIEMGYDFWEKADLIVFYMDRGMSPGMKEALAKAFTEGKPYEQRWLKTRPAKQTGELNQQYEPSRLEQKPGAMTPVDLDKMMEEVRAHP